MSFTEPCRCNIVLPTLEQPEPVSALGKVQTPKAAGKAWPSFTGAHSLPQKSAVKDKRHEQQVLCVVSMAPVLHTPHSAAQMSTEARSC